MLGFFFPLTTATGVSAASGFFAATNLTLGFGLISSCDMAEGKEEGAGTTLGGAKVWVFCG